MRCPFCRASLSLDATICAACGRRPFTWLGDPFGTQELPGAAVVALPAPGPRPIQVLPSPRPRPAGVLPAPQPRPVDRLTPDKLIVAILAVSLGALHAPLLAGGLLAVVVLLFWRWPRLRTVRFLVILLVALLLGLIGVPAAPQAMAPSNRPPGGQTGPLGDWSEPLALGATPRSAKPAARHGGQGASARRPPGGVGLPWIEAGA
jgi:hypothetical protein